MIYVDISEKKLNQSGVSGATIIDTLSKQNMVVDAGNAEVNTERMRISPSGYFASPVEIGELNIKPSTLDVMSQLVTPSGDSLGPQQLGVQSVQQLSGREATEAWDTCISNVLPPSGQFI